MSTYVDGFVLPVPTRNLDRYREMATLASEVWREHGALEYRECVGDDLAIEQVTPFPRQLDLKPGETVVFAWIVFKSREHRDEVNAKALKDPRLTGMCKGGDMPFDCQRMVYGGFTTIVHA